MVLGHKNVENVNQINVGSAVIDRVSEIKYLGCIIDEKLNFNSNCDLMCKKMAKKTNFFGRISNKLNKSTRLLVYNTIIAPHINYCSTILFLSDKSHIHRIQKLQNKCMRIILRKKRTKLLICTTTHYTRRIGLYTQSPERITASLSK